MNFEVPAQVWEDLEYEIARNELECADNYRAARVGVDSEEDEYESIQNRGCCGSFDTWTKVGGVKWAIGCNYGH